MENNPQVKNFDLGFVVTYDLFLSAAFQDLFKPLSQVQWYKASRAHPTNPRVWAFTTNRTANYLPGNFHLCRLWRKDWPSRQITLVPGQLVAVKSKCCGRTIPRSYHFKEVGTQFSVDVFKTLGRSRGSWFLREYDGPDNPGGFSALAQWWGSHSFPFYIFFMTLSSDCVFSPGCENPRLWDSSWPSGRLWF